MENEVFPNDLSFLTQQLRYEIRKNLKFWVDEQIKKFIKPPARVTVIYEKVRKTKWADMTIKKNNLYTIRLYYGENLERITNADMIEMFKDSVLHEISHITTYIKYGPGHRHDRIWKQEAVRVGTIPRRATSPVYNKLVRSGAQNFKILCKGSANDSIEFWRSVQKDYRGYFVFDKKTHKPLYFFQKRSSYWLFTNAIMECPKCKKKKYTECCLRTLGIAIALKLSLHAQLMQKL